MATANFMQTLFRFNFVIKSLHTSSAFRRHLNSPPNILPTIGAAELQRSLPNSKATHQWLPCVWIPVTEEDYYPSTNRRDRADQKYHEDTKKITQSNGRQGSPASSDVQQSVSFGASVCGALCPVERGPPPPQRQPNLELHPRDRHLPIHFEKS